jgi:tight adherence protein C
VTAVLAFLAAGLGVLGVGLVADGGVRSVARGRMPRPGHGPMLLALLVRFGRAAARRAAPADLERRLAAAGRPGGLGAREVLAAKFGAAVAATPPAVLLGALAPGRLGWLLTVAAPLGGFMAPDLWLRRLATARAAAVRRALPELLDLLRVTVDAGVSLPAALAAVGDRASGPLAAEWTAVGREVALDVPLGDALAAMEARMPLPEIRMLVGALDRSRRYGAPLADTLAGQARDARLGLSRHVREEAAKAGPKIQLVVALLLVPSVLLLVAAALISALVGSGGADLGGWA